jgi:sulfur-oxidizing protein SoxY
MRSFRTDVLIQRLIAAAFALGLSVSASAQVPDPDASAIWQKVRASLFGAAAIESADNVITLETPKRAEDAAIVPIAIRASFPQTPERAIQTIWLFVDNNPSPVAAVFQFAQESGRADIETRIRVEEYTYVRAVARTSDGKLHMAANYVKASGGCSAPAGKDAIAARANLGKMRLRVDGGVVPGQPSRAQLMVSHPNDSGLALDQITRTYAQPHFVRRIEVRYAGKPVLLADVDFSISENPNLRFYFTPGNGGDLDAKVVDNQDLQFATSLKLASSGSAASSAP